MTTHVFRSLNRSDGWEPLSPDVPIETLERHPDVRTLELSKGRGGLDAAGFAVGEPSRFQIPLRRTEVLLVLEGRITAELEDGTLVDLGPGQCIQLDGGQTVTWTYHEQVKMFYVLQTPV